MPDNKTEAKIFACTQSTEIGKNIAKAAIQASKLGIGLDKVSGIMGGLLDFQSSLQAEMEASVLIGRQLNYSKAIQYYNQVLLLSKSKGDVALFFNFGYSLEQAGKMVAAADQYKIAALSEATLGQLAAFRLGQIYIELNQFNNPLNVECHLNTTCKEILYDTMITDYDSQISAFIAGTGTGGTLMGVQQGFKSHSINAKIIAVEPAESPVMSGGKKGLHGIQGIGDGSKFLVDLDVVDEIIPISTEEAKERALRLAKENGLFVGISAGANVLASERWIKKNNPDGIVVTILCDRGERYFSVL